MLDIAPPALSVRRTTGSGQFCAYSAPLRPRCAGLVLVLALALPAFAGSTTVGAILAAPDQYNGQSVTLQGALTHLSKRVSQRGNAYYTFDLEDRTGAIRVFSFGTAQCGEKASVTVEGTFEKVKRVGRYTFVNEITATQVRCR
jgi:hypothetical protein